MQKLLLLFAILLSESTQAQSFQTYVGQLPKINIPLKFKEDYFTKWNGVDLPASLFNSNIDINTSKAIGRLDINDDYYVVLIKKFYNNGNDFTISAFCYSLTGVYNSKILLYLTADGEDKNFSVLADSTLQILSSGTESGFIKSYRLTDGNFTQIGDKTYIDDVDAFLRNN
jgi:hypothetical protein